MQRENVIQDRGDGGERVRMIKQGCLGSLCVSHRGYDLDSGDDDQVHAAWCQSPKDPMTAC